MVATPVVLDKDVDFGLGQHDQPRDNTRKGKANCLICVDFIEDRMRTRFVAVFVAFAMYLIVGTELLRFGIEPQIETAASAIFASSLPAYGFIGPRLSERATSVSVVSSLGRAYSKRVCPNIQGDVCERNASASEPVFVSARIESLEYAPLARARARARRARDAYAIDARLCGVSSTLPLRQERPHMPLLAGTR